MKLIILIAVVAWAEADKLDRDYLPPRAQASAGSTSLLQAPNLSSSTQNNYSSASVSNTKTYTHNTYSSHEARPERPQAALEKNAAILYQNNSNDGETFSYAYETENGIYAVQSGVATNGVQAQGGYSYTGDDGKIYSVDENGFVPQGDHFPTPHPIPEAILKVLEQNARDEAAGIYDDGSYPEVKCSGKNHEQYYNTKKGQRQPINNKIKSSSVEKEYLPPFPQRNSRRNRY